MKQCKYCGGTDFIKKGVNHTSSGIRLRVKCTSCERQQYVDDAITDNQASSTATAKFTPDVVKYGQRFVITSIQNNTPTNQEFLKNLELYCDVNDSELLAIPLIYEESLYDALDWDIDSDYLIRDTFSLNNKITVLGGLNVIATAFNPISALETLSKGTTLIVPHNQLQLKSLPVTGDAQSVILTSTGTVSTKNYPHNKTGRKAEFNHSNSAIVIEFSNDIYHIRVLNCDDRNGFYDINGYYVDGAVYPLTHVDALITGDEHVVVRSEPVMNATYYDTNSIVNTLKPKIIVRHDVLDCFTISHHHVKDHFIQYSKFVTGFNRIEDELAETINFIESTTPSFATSYLVSSNHNDHLNRWLTEADPKREPWNAKLFHHLSLLMLEEIENNSGKICKPNSFELYCKTLGKRFKFIGRTESFKLHDIELSNHGDRGASGSRGSLTQFSKLADKVVIGHSHTPGIDKGAYSVGCCTGKDLEYVSGPSSWMNTHCVIYPNGKRQLINIINGKWR